MQFNLEPSLATQVPHNTLFYAVRAEPGVMVMAGGKTVISVPGRDVKLGDKFFNINGVLVREDLVSSYKEPAPREYPGLKLVGTTPVPSYKSLSKGAKRKKRK